MSFFRPVARSSRDGRLSALYFDRNNNASFALMHAGHEESARAWTGIGNEHRLVQLYVLSLVDVAMSKIARFSEQDRADIVQLTTAGLIRADRLRQRATEALGDYVGDLRPVKTSLDLALRDIDTAAP